MSANFDTSAVAEKLAELQQAMSLLKEMERAYVLAVYRLKKYPSSINKANYNHKYLVITHLIRERIFVLTNVENCIYAASVRATLIASNKQAARVLEMVDYINSHIDCHVAAWKGEAKDYYYWQALESSVVRQVTQLTLF